jgi:hypothetical protein
MSEDFGSLYGEFTRDAVVEDAAKADTFPTYPAGTYLFKPESAKVRFGDNPDFARLYERPYATIRGQLLGLEDGVPVGTFFFDVSWEEHRIIAGKSVKVTDDIAEDARGERLDRESKLWGNLEKVMTNGSGKQSVGSILDSLKPSNPFIISVSESFKTEDGYKSTKEPAMRAAFQKAGYRAYNGVNTIKALV